MYNDNDNDKNIIIKETNSINTCNNTEELNEDEEKECLITLEPLEDNYILLPLWSLF